MMSLPAYTDGALQAVDNAVFINPPPASMFGKKI